jgi:hypothetical protein
LHTRLLIDAIVRQTTVLIAELSTASGLRAPLSHVANEVFLSLSREIVGVLSDLVQNGLLHASGRGASAVYGITSDAERHLFVASSEAESLGPLFWALVRGSSHVTTRGLAEATRLELAAAESIVERLIVEGRVVRKGSSEDAPLEAAPLFVPVGTEVGWEASVLDHFRAVSNAIAAKLRSGKTRSAADDVVGGTTLSFKLDPAHPLAGEVRGLLSRTRRESIALWERVEAENRARPVPDDASSRVWFYFGQYEEGLEEES